ncbi:MAG: hypothetical protein ABSG25_13600, partial [Bryobacteraceae bacterium]
PAPNPKHARANTGGQTDSKQFEVDHDPSPNLPAVRPACSARLPWVPAVVRKRRSPHLARPVAEKDSPPINADSG